MFSGSAEERGRLNHADEDALPGTARPDGCLLARRELPLGGTDLPLRQPAAEAAADARGREAHAAGALGHDSRAELHLRAPEPGHQEVRPRHDLRLRPRARRSGRRGQHVPRGHLQRDLPRRQPGRGRAAEALPPVLVSRRHSEPRVAGVPGLHPRGRRAGLFAQPLVRGGVRQPRAHRRLRRRRRRGGDGSAGHRMALEQVPRSGDRRRGAADPAPQRLQDRQPDHPGPHRARGAGAAASRLRVDAPFRRGSRARAHARGHGHDPRRGGGGDQEDPGRCPRPRQPHASALADDRPRFTQRLDGAEGRGWSADRGHVPGASGAHPRGAHPSRAPRAPGGMAEELPARGALRRGGPSAAGAGRARAGGRAAHGREPPRQRGHAAPRPAHAGLP